MTERNIAAEVLDGLREVREHRAGRRTLRTVRVEPRPLPELTPATIRAIRSRLDMSRAVLCPHDPRPRPHRGTLGAGQVQAARYGRRPGPHGTEVPGHVRAPRLAVALAPAPYAGIGTQCCRPSSSLWPRRATPTLQQPPAAVTDPLPHVFLLHPLLPRHAHRSGNRTAREVWAGAVAGTGCPAIAPPKASP